MVKLAPIEFKMVRIKEHEIDETIWYPRHVLGEVAVQETIDTIGSQLTLIQGLINAAKRADHTPVNRLVHTLLAIRDGAYEYRREMGLKKSAAACDRAIGFVKSGHKVVLFAAHRDVLVDLQNRTRRYGSKMIFAGSSAPLKRRAIKGFHQSRKHNILIVAHRAADASLDLSVSDKAIFVEGSWSVDEDIQAVLRLHNVNQKNPLSIEWLFTTDEDKIIQDVFRHNVKAAVTKEY